MKILLIILIFTIIILFILYNDLYLSVTKHEIKDKIIDKDLKIIHISDYHSEKNKIINKQILDLIDKEKPDYIFITGDMIGSLKLNVDVSISFMEKIAKNNVVYYSCGNHEGLIRDFESYKKRLRDININVLDNKSVNLTKNIILNGIDDPFLVRKKANGKDREIVVNEIESLNINKNKFNMLLSHRPHYIDLYKDFDLAFSGHAHGGQFRIFNHGIYAPGQGLFPKLTAGLIQKDNLKLIISRGIGVFNTGFPLRINNRPEVIIVNLRSNNEKR